MFISNPTARLGEKLAAKYLEKQGYKILEKNFREKYKELDIVVVKDNVLVFVEVKTRTSNYLGGVRESISYSKIKKLINAAQFYKISHKNLPEQMRIDAVLIDLQNGENIEHVENISGF